jgi:hypothetical protein
MTSVVRSHRFRSLAIITAAALAITGVSTLGSAPAIADSAPPDASTPKTVSSDSLPAPQINGVVWDQEIVGDIVYVGGNFTKARPAGAAPGVSEVTRAGLLSYRLSTGQLTSWAPTLNAQADAIDASPDGSRIYVGGGFTMVNGAARNRIVAFDTATGNVITSFAASANGEVFAVDSTATTVYFAGNFTQANGVARPGRAAAAAASTGATTSWAPVLLEGRAYGLVVSPDGSRVVLGGSFTSLNGGTSPGYGLGAVTSTTGTSLGFPINTVVRNAGANAAIYSLAGDGDSVYGTGYVFGTGGNLEGAFRADWNGNFVWVEDCHGDTYSVAPIDGVVYTTGHTHYCGNIGGSPELTPRFEHRAQAFTKSVTGTMTRDIYGYYKWTGLASPSQLNWFPSINAGTFTGIFQGAWTVTGNAQYVLYAGEFTTVNGVGQQGLARFAVSTVAPNKDGPQVTGGNWPIKAVSSSSGTVAITWPSNHDRDNSMLSYRVIRDGNTAAPIATISGSSNMWDRPGLGFVDQGQVPGSTHNYRVRAVDPFGNFADSATVSVVVASSGTLSEYARAVITSGPTWYFRLGETGTGAANSAGPVANSAQSFATRTVDATLGSAATRGRPGAIVGDPNPATGFNGTTSSRGYTSANTWVDDSISVEAWFKTTGGGKIVGFGDRTGTSNSANYDRHLYVSNGRVMWGVFDGTNRILQSGTGMNNGAWHHVVGTVGPSGQFLYVDGNLVASASSVVKGGRYWGYWRIGGDATWSGNQNFSGDIDEVAVYKTVLSPAVIAQHNQLGRGAVPANQPPAASFTATTSGLTGQFNAGGSTDADGTIVAYEWTFGDGTTGTGVTASRVYAAAGNYTVGLTVRDDDGATNSTTRTVTVTNTPPPAVLAQDAFSRTAAGGWGSAPTGGAWTLSAPANFAVNGSQGTVVHTPGALRRALLASVSTNRVDLVSTFSLDKAPTGGASVIGIVGRQVGTDYYQARVRYLVGGAVRLELVHGGTTLIGFAEISGLTVSAGQSLSLRTQVVGTNPTTIRGRVWPTGTTEPSTWHATVTDSTPALQTAGSVGLESYLSGSATNSPVTVRYEDFTATPVP